MERFDIAIIGTGPAGLEAAITAKVRNKNILLLGGSNLSTKVEKAHTIENYLGLPHASGDDMQEAFSNHLKQMDISITEDRVNTVYAMGQYFAIQGHKDNYEASSVILACGLSASRPFPGEIENLGRGVSYCATCDGNFYRGKTVAVLGYSKQDEKEAEYLADIAVKVYYLPMYKEEINIDERIQILPDTKVSSINRTDVGIELVTDKDTLQVDGVFILREDVAPSQLVPGLKMDDKHISVDRNMATNLPGLYACGDIVGPPYQYIKAAGQGNIAALSAVNYLAEEKFHG